LKLITVSIVAFAVQVGLIYWTSDRKPYHPRTAIERPAVQLAALAHNELLALNDPTIFSRAHAEGFSGPAWLSIRVDLNDTDTNAAPQQWLALASVQLGENFRDYIRTNSTATLPLAFRPHPELTQLGAIPASTMATASFVELKDALAARSLATPLPLPSQTNADILQTSEVQLLVDSEGNSISAVLLKSSGLKTADQFAVRLALNAQFKPAHNAPSSNSDESNKSVLGRMIFHWYTVPAPASTNGSPDPQ